MCTEQCNHTWSTNTGKGGKPSYLGPRGLMHVWCIRGCGARTFFTADQWIELPRKMKTERPRKTN
jgi:hypothetical protein